MYYLKRKIRREWIDFSHCGVVDTVVLLAVWLLPFIENKKPNNCLTPWGRVLLEKLTGSQLDKKFHTF